jgi:hypothetical protein
MERMETGIATWELGRSRRFIEHRQRGPELAKNGSGQRESRALAGDKGPTVAQAIGQVGGRIGTASWTALGALSHRKPPALGPKHPSPSHACPRPVLWFGGAFAEPQGRGIWRRWFICPNAEFCHSTRIDPAQILKTIALASHRWPSISPMPSGVSGRRMGW